MKYTSKKSFILATLVSVNIFYSCSPQNVKEEISIIGPAKNKPPVELVNIQGNFLPSSSSSPTSKPSVSPTLVPSSSATPYIVMPSINPIAPTTYMIPLSVKTGTATAYLTYTSTTYGKILVNFKNLGDIPNKIQLLDQFGNVLNTTKTFNVAIAGNSVFTFYKQANQKISKIQLFFVNDSMVEDTLNDTPTVVDSEPAPQATSTPTPTPTPTVTPTPIIPSNQWTVSTFAGNGADGFADGTGTNSKFSVPQSITMDSSGNIFVADTGNQKIRKITSTGVVTTIAGSTYGYLDGDGTNAKFWDPIGITVDNSGNVFVADTTNNLLRKITSTGVVTTIAGSTYGYLDGAGTNAKFFSLEGIAIDNSGNIFVADTNNHVIRKIDNTGVVSTFAGSGIAGFADGTATNAEFKNPLGITVDNSGNVFVADTFNNRIRKITPAGVVTTVAGSGTAGFADGTGTNAQFYNPYSIKADNSGNIFVADTKNNKIRKITSAGVVTTIAGSTIGSVDGVGTSAKFNLPYGITINPSGVIYISDANNKIRKITPIP